MTEEKFSAILGKQVPDAIKRAGADFLVHTGIIYLSSPTHVISTIVYSSIFIHPYTHRLSRICPGKTSACKDYRKDSSSKSI